MMQDHQGNYISSNIRGLVYEISKFVSTSDVERAFQRSGLTIKHAPGERPDTPQAMFTAWSTSIDWKDKRRAIDGLKALSRVTQRARAVEMEQYDGTWVVGFSEYDGWVEELERDCADEGLQYDRGTGRITPRSSPREWCICPFDKTGSMTISGTGTSPVLRLAHATS